MNILHFKSTSIGILCLVAAFACSKSGHQYGDKLTLSKTTALSEILAKPADYVGKRVMIEGQVLDVCAMKGCWIDVAGDANSGKIKVKVEDDVIVFPQDVKGKIARVEGEVEQIDLTEEQAINWHQHQADEQGETFDPSTVSGGETVYRIKGFGAVISDAE